MMKEMASRGHIVSNVVSGISIRADSRYDSPVCLPTPNEVQLLLAASDRLANSKNQQIAKAWERYRPMLYLAADTGMRLQEYKEAGLVEKIKVDGETIEKTKYKPYDLRHFFASMLIEQRVNLKRIQKLMGHEDVKTTLNVYGHLIEKAESSAEERIGMIQRLGGNTCGKSVASKLQAAEI